MSTHKPSTLLRTLILLTVIFANLAVPVEPRDCRIQCIWAYLQ